MSVVPFSWHLCNVLLFFATTLSGILSHIFFLWGEQNRILHNQLEALHIRLAEQERGIAGLSSQRTDSHGEDDLHGVISYLRRSKEIVSTHFCVCVIPYSLWSNIYSFNYFRQKQKYRCLSRRNHGFR